MNKNIIALALGIILAVLGLNLVAHANPDGVNVIGPAEPFGGIYITPGSRARDLTSGMHKTVGIDQNQSLLVSYGDVETAWAIQHTPAANTQATITKAAGATGVKHVATSVTVTFSNNASGAAAVGTVFNLRDGATGAGTILWSSTIWLPATAGLSRDIRITFPVPIPGTAATAMTLEAAAAGGANTLQSVALTGYDIK